MRRFAIAGFIFTCLVACSSTVAQQTPPKPSGGEEKVTVTLVQIGALAMNKKDVTVPDLTKDDFELKLGDRSFEIGSFDVFCPIGSAPDPLPLKKSAPLPAPLAPEVKRRVVYVFDYYFLDQPMRAQLLDAAAGMLRDFKTPDEEVMIVALAYGVRIEQRFTTDVRLLTATLDRMKHDVTLWARSFPVGSTGQGYFDDLMSLMDVLSGHDGEKGIVLFSQASAVGAMRDLWYNDVAMHAARSRSVIYPADPDLLLAPDRRSETLARLANQSGGRMPYFTNDVTIPYRWVQRDLSCRYTVGAYIDPTEGRQRQAVALSVKRPGVQLRYPEMIKLFTDAEKKALKARAAFVDPTPYENPLVRAYAFPLIPVTPGAWETLVTLHFPMPVGAEGADLNVQAVLRRDQTQVDKYEREFHIAPPADGGERRPVTLLGDSTLKQGRYELAVVLSKPNGPKVVSASVLIDVPQVPANVLVLSGPLFARVVPGGLLLRANPKAKPAALEEILGPDATIEPMLVNQIGTADELLYYWNACVQGKPALHGGEVVRRTFTNEHGEVTHRMKDLPLALVSRGKNLSCQTELEKLPANTLPPGDYSFDVVVTSSSGDLIAKGQAPLLVK